MRLEIEWRPTGNSSSWFGRLGGRGSTGIAPLLSAAPVLYASDGNGLLYTLNPADGQTHAIGRMPQIMYDLASSPGGKLYGVDSRSNLYSIDPGSAGTKLIGYTGASLNGLTFSSGGTLYASGNNGVYTVSTSSGHATEVETLGSNTSAGDLAFDASGNLFMTTNSNNLVHIDLSAHTFKVVGAIGFNQVLGLVESPSGVLYGLSNATRQVIAINPGTGHGTLVASFHSGAQVGAFGTTYGVAPAVVNRPTIYAADDRGELFTLNLGTGQTHKIGVMGVTLYDLAEDTHGNLFGVDSSSNLYRINSTNAKVTRVGATSVFLNALTFAPNGTLYGAGNNGLYTLSTSTGKSTLLGTLGSNTSAGDLAFDKSGNLYLTTNANNLLRINLSARTFTTVGSIGFNAVFGLIFGSDGILYGLSNSTDQAFSINLTTGHGTLVSSFAGQVGGVDGSGSGPITTRLGDAHVWASGGRSPVAARQRPRSARERPGMGYRPAGSRARAFIRTCSRKGSMFGSKRLGRRTSPLAIDRMISQLSERSSLWGWWPISRM